MYPKIVIDLTFNAQAKCVGPASGPITSLKFDISLHRSFRLKFDIFFTSVLLLIKSAKFSSPFP